MVKCWAWDSIGPAGKKVLSVVSGFTSSERARRRMIVIQPCIDDSGTHKGGNVFVLAGFVARVDRWALFADRWKEALDAPPKIDCFKMREAASLHGRFSGFSCEERDKKIIALLSTLKRVAAFRVECVIWLEPYDELIKGNRHRYFDHPYFFGFYQTILATLNRQKEISKNYENAHTRADLIFDEQVQFKHRVLRYYEMFKELAPPDALPYLGDPPAFKDDETFMPLQPADMLAWCLGNERNENPKRVTQLVFKELSRIAPATVHQEWDENELRKYAEFSFRKTSR